ncbi:MAG TPA: hypothetical protein V6C99_09840 [Oculatellaceae cyanobacterium]|jgi:phenylpyruvate tautomerase PptA (4-oxalocrotonate tautomerase family)
MPYLLVVGPEFSTEQRKIMAQELTDGLMNALQLPEACRNWVTVQFFSYHPDQIAVGGRLLSEIEERNYYCLFQDIHLSDEKKEKIVTHIFPLLLELLGLDASQAEQVKMLFNNCAPDDVVIGGCFLHRLLEESVLPVTKW